jgi:prepilin-type N-terminal cleavage/methylation domain-containing protein
MKGVFMKQRHAAGSAARRERALTLVEMMVAMSIFSLVSLGLVYTNLFALRQDELANSKLGASDSSRRGFSLLADDVRAAKIWQLGNGNLTTFTPIANGTAQQGTALKISLTVDTNSYILYYFDTTKGELRRRKSGETGSKLIAQNLTNTMYFREEDYKGVLQTDLSHKDVIYLLLDFYQYQYPLTKVGPGYFYDRYKMEFRLTSHVPDGQ